MKKSQELLGTGGCAHEARRGVETIRRWQDRGLLPFQRDSAGRRLVKRSDLEAFLRKRQAQTECA